MRLAIVIVVFVVCLGATLGASEVLVRGIDRVGARFHLSISVLGLVTALGADSPEISSALVAVFTGAGDVGVGVIFGSNIFNLAALLGLSAVIAPPVQLRRTPLALHGGVALVVTLLVAAFAFHLLSSVPLMLLLLLVFVPYLVTLAVRPSHVPRLLRPLAPLVRSLAAGQTEVETAGTTTDSDDAALWRTALLILLALGVIVGGSVGLVRATLTLAGAWGLPRGLVGILVLAALTGLPNAYAAVRLARQGRGAAVVSETFNSNTINLLVGIGLPALIVGLGHTGSYVTLTLAWLLAMTVIVLVLLARPGGLSRAGGAGIIGLYLLFVVVRVAAPALSP